MNIRDNIIIFTDRVNQNARSPGEPKAANQRLFERALLLGWRPMAQNFRVTRIA